MRDTTGISQMALVAIIVVVIGVAAAAFVILSMGPAAPTATTTTTAPTETTTETTPTSAETTETTPTTTETTATKTETPTTTTETVETTPTTTLPQIEYTAPRDVMELLRTAKSMTYQWTSPEDAVRYSYEILGEESIGEETTWKVKVQFTNDDTQEFILWISQVDGSVKQVEIEGETITGELAGYYQSTLILVMMPFTTFSGYDWAWQEYWTLPSEVGVIHYQGSETQSFGPTTLTVQKFRYDPNPLYEAAKDLEHAEWGFAQMDSIGMVTHFSVELKTGEFFTFDLVSVSRA